MKSFDKYRRYRIKVCQDYDDSWEWSVSEYSVDLYPFIYDELLIKENGCKNKEEAMCSAKNWILLKIRKVDTSEYIGYEDTEGV